MTTKLNKWMLRSSLAAAALLSAAGWAMGPPGGADHDPARMMSHITAKLDLSAEQQTQVQQLLASSREATTDGYKRLSDLREELMNMRADFDAGKARKIADEIGELTSQLIFETSSTWAGVYQLLNAQQKTEMDQLMAQRESRRGKWHKGGGKTSSADSN